MFRLIIGAVLGAFGMYAYTSSSSRRKKLKALGSGVRLPKPVTTVDLPADKEDITILDMVICECATEAVSHTPDILTTGEDQLVATLQVCSASKIYGEFPWPPVPGDHPTVHQLWGVLGYRCRLLVLSGQLMEYCSSQSDQGPLPLPPAPLPPPQTPGHQFHGTPTGP